MSAAVTLEIVDAPLEKLSPLALVVVVQPSAVVETFRGRARRWLTRPRAPRVTSFHASASSWLRRPLRLVSRVLRAPLEGDSFAARVMQTGIAHRRAAPLPAVSWLTSFSSVPELPTGRATWPTDCDNAECPTCAAKIARRLADADGKAHELAMRVDLRVGDLDTSLLDDPDAFSSAWSNGSISGLTATKANAVAYAMGAIVETNRGVALDEDRYKPANAAATKAARQAGKGTPAARAAAKSRQAEAQAVASAARRSMAATAPFIAAVADERERLAEILANSVEGHRAGVVDEGTVEENAIELVDFVELVDSRYRCVREAVLGDLSRRLRATRTPPATKPLIPPAPRSLEAEKLLALIWKSPNVRRARKARPDFVEDVLLECLERRAAGRTSPAAELVKQAVDTVRQRVERSENAMDHVDWAVDLDGMPRSSPLI